MDKITSDIADIENYHILQDYISAEKSIANNYKMFNTLIRPFLSEKEKEDGGIYCCRPCCKESTFFVSYGIAFNNKFAFCEKHGLMALISQIDRINDKKETIIQQENINWNNVDPGEY